MAALVKWDRDLETGRAFMDDDHRRFVELLNDLHHAARDGAGRSAVPAVVTGMVEVMKTHFLKEEAAMRKSRYPLLSDHTMQHDFMRIKLDGLARDVDADRDITAGEVIDFMMTWLAQHIRRHDMDLARHLAKKASVGG